MDRDEDHGKIGTLPPYGPPPVAYPHEPEPRPPVMFPAGTLRGVPAGQTADHLEPNLGPPPDTVLLARQLSAMAADIRQLTEVFSPGFGHGVQPNARAVASLPIQRILPDQAGNPVDICPRNAGRRGVVIYHENPSTAVLFLSLSSRASVLLYSVQILGGAFYELAGPPYYGGEITGIFATAAGVPVLTGAALVTELI